MPACHAGDRRFESGRVRHHRISLRPVRPPGRGVPLPGCRQHPRRSKRRSRCLARPRASSPIAIGRCPSPGGELGFGRGAEPRRRAPLGSAAGTRARRRRPRRSRPPRATAGAVAAVRRRAPPSRPPARRRRRRPIADVPIVPVTNFRATADRDHAKEVADVLAGTSTPLRRRSSSSPARPTRSSPRSGSTGRPTPTRLVLAARRGDLAADLAKNRKRLAFLRADAVGPEVRALAWGDKALFGVDRVKDLADWPLTARAARAGRRPTPTTRRRPGPCSPAATSCSTAASTRPSSQGQGRRLPVRRRHRRHHRPRTAARRSAGTCPTTKRTGDAGAFRDLDRAAPTSPLANFENPAPNNASCHTSGTVFSADPKLIDGLARRRHRLRRRSPTTTSATRAAPGSSRRSRTSRSTASRSRGAGKNLAAARKPAILEAGGTKVAILGYDAIAGGYHATATKVGSAPAHGQVRQGGRRGRAQGRRRRRDRLPALGHRVRPDARSPASRSWPG